MTRRRRGTRTAILSLLLFSAGPLAAQVPGAGPPRSTHGILVGARVGVDYFDDALMLGGQTHFLLDPWGLIDLMPNAEVSFKGGVRKWQLNADLAVMPSRGGLYLGGGGAFRNTLYEVEKGRETRTGYSVFVGIRPPPEPGEINVQVELRWSFISDFERPRSVSVGANWPLLVWR